MTKKKIIYIIWSIFYFIVLDFIYKKVQINLFSYVGYKFESNFIRTLIGWSFYLFGSFLFYSKKEKISSTFFCVIYYLSISPFIILYMRDERIKLWMVIYQIFVLFFIKIGLKLICRNQKSVNNKKVKLNFKIFKIIFFLLSIFFIAMIIKNGISFKNISFENIYKIRRHASFSLVEILLLNLFSKIIIPLFIVELLDKKKFKLFTYLICIQIYFYTITGFKTTLFIPIILIGFKLLNKKSINILIIKGLSFSLISSYIIYYFKNYVMIVALITNRVFFLPAMIKYSYFDFFTNNKFLYFSETTIGKIFKISPVYNKYMVYIIGEKYFNRPQMWTNTGFIADSFAQFGIVGSLIIGIIAIIELYFIDKITKSNNFVSIFPVFLLYYISLNDGSLISVSFSGGMILAIILYFFLTKE